MKHETLTGYPEDKFRRITGAKRKTFERMMEILTAAYVEKHRRRGRKPKLRLEDMPLATLEHLREYRAYAHIAASCQIDESNPYRAVKWVEETLLKDGAFSLPGKKALLKSGMECEAVLADATETPVERPKKNGGGAIRGKEASYGENAGGREEIRRKDHAPGLRLRAAARLSAVQGIADSLPAGQRAAS